MRGFFSTLPYSRTFRQLGSIACAALFLAACSSGGGDGGGGTPPAATPTTGTFVDSPVDGLHYTTTSNPGGGFTSGGGHFQCQSGDNVTFDLAGKVIGNPQPCSSDVVTAVSVFGALSVADQKVVNLSQLLLTLGPIVNNVIQLPQPLPPGFNSALVPAFDAGNFDIAVQAALPKGTTLVSEAQANTHLQTSFKKLSVTVVNSGTVTSNPAGITCTAGTCSYDFVAGTAVALTEMSTGFIGWTGDCQGPGLCNVTMNVAHAVTAKFPGTPPPATLTILPNQGTGAGSVACSTNGGTSFGPCDAPYPNPTALVLQATPNSGSTFSTWIDGTGSATGCNNTTVNCSITLIANSAVRANFTLSVTQFSVTGNTASANGGGGTVQCSAGGGAAGPCGSYPVGTAIAMTATPNGASNFTGWNNGSGNANVVACNGTTTPCTFTLTTNSSITANFNRPTLTVVVSGTGTVNSSPAGINNCTTNCSAAFNKGTSITLTAGAGFTSWSGGCSGTSSTCQVSLTADTTVTALFSTSTGSIFPLTIDPTSRRYLVDHTGVPFPILGRTAWFITSLSETDFKTFIDDTAAKGYNAIEFHVVNHDSRGNNEPFGGNGALPFTYQLNGSAWTGSLSAAPDFSRPNLTYWTHVDALLAYAESKGILCFMFPAYAGYAGGSQGWMQEMVANGSTRMQAYGAFIANRYKTRGNIVWMLGGDYGTGGNSFKPEELAVEQAMLAGMQSIGGQASVNVSAEWNSESIYTDQADPTLRAAGTLEGAYSFSGYANTYPRNGYAHSPVMPTFLLEEPYDQEGPDGNNVNGAATQPVRRFQWWGWLSGIGGYISGNGCVWPFNSPNHSPFPFCQDGWQAHLNTQGAQDMARLNAFVRSIAWYNLVPSGLNGMRILVTSGGSNVSFPDYVAAAATLDGTLLVAYVPPDHSGSITIDMTAMSGPMRARWFNPASAAYTLIGTFDNTGTASFTPPGDNGTGFTDWVLLLEKQ